MTRFHLKTLGSAVILVAATGFFQQAYTRQATFSFQNFTSLKQGNAFIITGKRNIKELRGTGNVKQLTRDRLHMTFNAEFMGRSMKADLRLQLLRKVGNDYTLLFDYRDSMGRNTSQVKSEVRADGFMAKNGMLTFFYNNRKNYFQMKYWPKSKENLVVLNWGSCSLRKI